MYFDAVASISGTGSFGRLSWCAKVILAIFEEEVMIGRWSWRSFEEMLDTERIDGFKTKELAGCAQSRRLANIDQTRNRGSAVRSEIKNELRVETGL